MNPQASRICPHCGADPGLGMFCQACGDRVVKRLAKPVLWQALSGAFWIIAVPAICFGGVLSACGLVAAGTFQGYLLRTGLTSLCLGLSSALIAVLVRACTRDSAGYRDVPFGRPEEGPRP